MKYIKLALVVMCVIFSIVIRISAQPIQPLQPDLELLKPVSVFPANADTAIKFIDNSKGNKPAISNANNKNTSFPVFSTEVFTSDSIKKRVIAWDVINEFVQEKDFFPYLPKDIAVQWFKTAKKQDPKAQLFINEYGMLNSIASPNNILEYIGVIAELRKAGAPIEAIGVQGHVGRQPRNPAQVITDLDLFIVTGLPVQITEFDINMSDEELQTDYTRDFLIACYSHPAITGFTIWGFWQGAHWKPDAAMFRNDWTPNPMRQYGVNG